MHVVTRMYMCATLQEHTDLVTAADSSGSDASAGKRGILHGAKCWYHGDSCPCDYLNQVSAEKTFVQHALWLPCTLYRLIPNSSAQITRLAARRLSAQGRKS